IFRRYSGPARLGQGPSPVPPARPNLNDSAVGGEFSQGSRPHGRSIQHDRPPCAAGSPVLCSRRGVPMAPGWLTWTCLLLAAQTGAAEDVVHMNQRGFQIPIRIQPERKAEVRELILFMSRDQGKTWEIYNRATPDKPGFEFFAASDGVLWFSV